MNTTEEAIHGVYIRVGATTRRADDATRHELALIADGRSFDREPCLKARIDDGRIRALCNSMYRIARSNCKTDSERRAVKRVTEEQLQSWGIISRTRGRWIASNAYALLVGDPAFATRVKCGVFKGDSKAIFIDRREITGSIYEQVEEAHKYILAKINMGCVIEGVQRRDTFELPPDALRELVVNALVHRNYFEHEAPVFVAVYDTRVEITSPGGLPRGLTPEKAIAGRSKIRNHALAAAFDYMKVIEAWGSGLKRVADELRQYGIAPLQIEDSGLDVRINVLRNQTGQVSESDKPTEKSGLTTEKTTEKSGSTTEKTAEKILRLIKEKADITTRELAYKCGLTEDGIYWQLKKLKTTGILRRVGPDKGGRWEMIEPAGVPT